MKKNEPAEPALLVLQSSQRTTNQIVNAAKVYANLRWRFDTKLRETLAGANYLQEQTVHQSGARQALLAPELSAAMYKAAPSPELCLALGLDDTTAAYDFAVIQVNKAGGITIIDAYQDAPGLCLTLLAEKACAHAQRHLARSNMGTRSTAYAPVLTDSAVERAEGIDLKACAEARRDLATSSLATLNTVFALCDPELLHQVAKDLGLDLAAQTPPVALSTLPLARVLDAIIAASVPDPGVESQVVSTELAKLLHTSAVPLATSAAWGSWERSVREYLYRLQAIARRSTTTTHTGLLGIALTQPSAVEPHETDSMKAISRCVKPEHKSVNLVYLSPTFPLSESFRGMPGRAEVCQLHLQQQVN